MDELHKKFCENGPAFLIHYNHNHDPRTGRFTNSLFVSGSSKTQNKDSGYYRKKLPKEVRQRLKESMRAGDRIIVGDAPGIDRQVQDYLKKKGYSNVEIYGPGKQVRYAADSKWKTNPIDAPEFEAGSKEWLAKKDVAMTIAATKGLAVILDEGSKATRNNIDRLTYISKPVDVFQLSKNGEKFDNWNSEITDKNRKIIYERFKYAHDHWQENLNKPDSIHSEEHYLDIIDAHNGNAKHDIETDYNPDGGWSLEQHIIEKDLRKKYNRI